MILNTHVAISDSCPSAVGLVNRAIGSPNVCPLNDKSALLCGMNIMGNKLRLENTD